MYKFMSFISFINFRYSKILKKKEIPEFVYWDDYALFLFENICNGNEEDYYGILEKDLKAFSDMQTGSERDNERKKISKCK